MQTKKHSRWVLLALLLCAAATGVAARSALAADEVPAAIDPTVNRLNLAVADLDRALQLYRDILGFKVDVTMPVKADSYMYDIFNVDRKAAMRLAFLSGSDKKFGSIGLTEVKGVDLPKAGGVHDDVLIIETRTRFDEIYDGVRKAKLEATQVYDLTRPSRREFMLTDYDGHRVLVMQLRPAQ